MVPALPLSPDVATRLAGTPLSILLDIDGTLAPIAPRPDQAKVPLETCKALESLIEIPDAHVAMVTGRSVHDARRMLPLKGLGVIGNHGFEMLGEAGEVISEPAAHSFLDVIATAARRLAKLTKEVPGVVLEDKRWTLSVHYRLAARPAIPTLTEHIHALAKELGLKVTRGKEVLELRPPLDVNKGTAGVLWVKRLGTVASGSVLYIGDDRTDEDAFRELRVAFPRAVTIRVGDPDHGETTEAEFRVETPAEVKNFLVALVSVRQSR
ncbi:MAG: trehalose-phosphatase [Gemmatimonadaceae bacterium]